MEECKKVLQQDSHIEVYDTECEKDFRLQLPVKPVLGCLRFFRNENPRNHLKLALGISDDSGQLSTAGVRDRSVSLSDAQGQSSTQQQTCGTRKKVVMKTKLLTKTKLLKVWKSPCDIYSICPTTDDRAWTQYDDKLTLLDRNGKVIQVIIHKAEIKDISLSPRTHRLWACDEENDIMELVSEQLSQRFRIKDEPKCICLTADRHIIIGMSKHITKYTTQGQIVLTTEAAGTATPLVCSPHRITECHVTNNIAVIDYDYMYDGGDGNTRVIVMDTDFRELFTYKGDIPKESSQTQGRSFNPQCVVYDCQGILIISDCGKDKIHILNGDGEVLRILDTDNNTNTDTNTHRDTDNTDTDGVWGVGVSRKGILWTVDINDKVKLLQYYE